MHFTLLTEEDSNVLINKIEEKRKHKSCFNKIIIINNIWIQKYCLEHDTLFFALKQNRFLHVNCNPISIEKLNKIKQKQIEIFKENFNQFFNLSRKLNLILNLEKLNTGINMLYNFHKCNNELKDSIICEECHKMISLKYVEKHVQTCKIEDCLFIHVDGRQCEHVKHNKLIHRNFINNTNVTEDKESTLFKKFNKIFYIHNLKETNEIIVYKTNNELMYTSHLVKSFGSKFDIVSKYCDCFIKLHACQCFRYCINNFSLELFKKRKEKTMHKAIRDLNDMPNIGKNKIAVINVNNQLGNPKFENFSFLSNFRKTNSIKFIFFHNVDFFQ